MLYFESEENWIHSQFGFRSNRSTELVCHAVVRNIFSNFSSDNYTLGKSLDLAKTSDLIQRRVLFKKIYTPLWYMMCCLRKV